MSDTKVTATPVVETNEALVKAKGFWAKFSKPIIYAGTAIILLGAGYLGKLTGGFLGSQYQDIFAFIVLALVLTLRPSGLLGERVADRA